MLVFSKRMRCDARNAGEIAEKNGKEVSIRNSKLFVRDYHDLPTYRVQQLIQNSLQACPKALNPGFAN